MAAEPWMVAAAYSGANELDRCGHLAVDDRALAEMIRRASAERGMRVWIRPTRSGWRLEVIGARSEGQKCAAAMGG